MEMEKESGPWKRLARKAVRAKAAEAQKARDLEKVVEELRTKLTAVESGCETAAQQAQDLIEKRDKQLSLIREWCERYAKGEFSPMEILAGITHVAEGDIMCAPTVLERRRVADQMRTVSLLGEATTVLANIELLLHDNGFPNTVSQFQQVSDLLDSYKEVVGA